jgi:hypothetical protein
MGHTEMRLAVAGLDQKGVREWVRRLADGDWTTFSAAERVAFRIARKQAKAAASLTEEDFRELVRHFGRERALDIIWWSCRCHYMTRVADAFQLPLERRNVFDGFLPSEEMVKRP